MEVVRNVLKFESIIVFFASIYFYVQTEQTLWLFGLWLIPDIGIIGYAINKNVGMDLYNAFHNYAGPSMMLVAAHMSESMFMVALALIWFSHISLDRFLGYGLKLNTGFNNTHLGDIGKK